MMKNLFTKVAFHYFCLAAYCDRMWPGITSFYGPELRLHRPSQMAGCTYITAEQYNINSQVKMAFGTITAIGNKSIESLLHPFGESRSNQHFFDSSPKCWQLPN